MTIEQKQYITENSSKHTIKEMELMFNVTRNVVHHMMKYYDLQYIKRVSSRKRDEWEGRCYITGHPLKDLIK